MHTKIDNSDELFLLEFYLANSQLFFDGKKSASWTILTSIHSAWISLEAQFWVK